MAMPRHGAMAISTASRLQPCSDFAVITEGLTKTDETRMALSSIDLAIPAGLGVGIRWTKRRRKALARSCSVDGMSVRDVDVLQRRYGPAEMATAKATTTVRGSVGRESSP